MKNRLQSCETTFELLEKYASVSQTSRAWIESASEAVTQLAPAENGVAARAQLDAAAVSAHWSPAPFGLQPLFRVAHVFFLFNMMDAQKVYNGVVANRTTLDDANALGARLMREAKVSAIHLPVRFYLCVIGARECCCLAEC